MSYRVFISHARQDKELAEQLVQQLESAGRVVVLTNHPFEIKREPDATIRIPRGIRSADEVAFLLTQNSLDSPNLLLELGAALGMDKGVTAIVERLKHEEVPELFRPQKTVDYTDIRSYVESVEHRARKAEDSIRTSVVNGLKHKRYRWRSLKMLASLAGTSQREVRQILRADPDRFVIGRSSSGHEIARLTERVR